MAERDVACSFLRWSFLRAVFSRGYWLVTSLYLVVDAGLSPFQLVFLGTAQGITALTMEVPTGVMADTISRKRSIVIAHIVMGAGMLTTGLVTAFPALVVTQMLWGLGWTFSSGADVAWLSDELDRPERVAGVLVASARWQQIGGACGLVGFGALAWATSLAAAIVISGLAMWALGVGVALHFTEQHFTPARRERWRGSMSILRRGLGLARRDADLRVIFAATLLVNGAAEGFGRLYAKRLVGLGFPDQPDPIIWLTALGLVAMAIGALALRLIETRIGGADVGRRFYAAACLVGALGLVVLALAPDTRTAMAGVLLVSGIAWTVTRCISVIWVDRRTPSQVRATVQSFLAQVEYLGEISLGLGLGILAQASSIAVAMLGSSVLVVGAGVLVARSRAPVSAAGPGSPSAP